MLWILDHLGLATALTFLTAIILMLGILLVLTRHYPHEATRAQFGTAMVSVIVTILFSVMLNHLYATRRDRDNRLRTIRDQHYAQLKPVLRIESSKLAELAGTITRQAHVSAIAQSEGAGIDPTTMLWPDVLSEDLGQHFPEYGSSKGRLLSDVNSQDQEFRDTLLLAEKSIRPMPGLNSYWREIVGRSFVDQCVGHGEGIKLTITRDGYQFAYLGGSSSTSGGGQNPPRPSPDQVAAFRAFRMLKAGAETIAHCKNLKHRGDVIRSTAENLSKQAQLLSEGTILRGTCDFIRIGSLSE